jgi:hypothetical protein
VQHVQVSEGGQGGWPRLDMPLQTWFDLRHEFLSALNTSHAEGAPLSGYEGGSWFSLPSSLSPHSTSITRFLRAFSRASHSLPAPLSEFPDTKYYQSTIKISFEIWLILCYSSSCTLLPASPPSHFFPLLSKVCRITALCFQELTHSLSLLCILFSHQLQQNQ